MRHPMVPKTWLEGQISSSQKRSQAILAFSEAFSGVFLSFEDPTVL